MLTSDDNSLINTAIDRVTKLKSDIETITEELFALDEEEKEKNPALTTSYRQARAEIVRVISSINQASSNISVALNKLNSYQKQMKSMLKELKEAQVSSEKAKQYLSEYMTLLYKMQLKIYDQD
jgi:chromosome segregation ATPase